MQPLSSYHPWHTFRGLAKSQLLRFHCICKQQDDFQDAFNTLLAAAGLPAVSQVLVPRSAVAAGISVQVGACLDFQTQDRIAERAQLQGLTRSIARPPSFSPFLTHKYGGGLAG
uniref:Helix-turn-helix domain-containing protein n=1 Tax=Oncorhynchus kisutch TaxID=8019 RepID=A0A8C7GRU0_ONCKI